MQTLTCLFQDITSWYL